MLGMKPKRRGLFGTPETYGTPPIWQGPQATEPMDEQPAPIPGLGMQSPQMMDEPQRKGLFGAKFNAPGGWAEKIAAIGGTLRDGDSGQAVADYFGAQDARAQFAARLRQASMERDSQWQDWVRKQEYEAAHPKPVNNDTVADYEFIRQNLGDKAAKTYLQNRADPPQYRQGPDGQFYRVQVGQGGVPTAPVGKLTPITDGGPQASPADTFSDAFSIYQR